MIISFFLSILFLLVNGVVSLLPVGELPVAFGTSVASIWGYVNVFSYVIAVSTLIQVVVLYIGFDLVVLLWHVVNWIIRKIPGMQ